MLKMFSTQLTGLLNRIHDKEEFSFEDGARLLAQAAVGAGHIYIYGTNEMSAVEAEALYSEEPLKWAQKFTQDRLLTEADRVLLVSRFANDEEALKIGKTLHEQGIPFVSISTVGTSEGDSLVDLADVHIDLHLKKGLLPDEAGNRFGYPASIAALFAYYGLKFTIDEIVGEYDMELEDI